MKKLFFLSVLLSPNLLVPKAYQQEKLESKIVYQAVPDVQKALPENSYVVDEILVVIYGPERTRVITKVELERLSLDGRKRTLDDLITEELLFQEGLKYKVEIDDTAIDRYIANIRKQYNCSLDDVKLIFKQAGYTYEEGREQLRMMNMTNAIIENIIMVRLHVPRHEVIAYYEQNPIIQEATYTLQMSMIPFDPAVPHDVQKNDLIQKIKQGKTEKLIWYDPFVLQENEIAPQVSFIKAMKAQDISVPLESARGFEVYRLVNFTPESPIPLENRYKEIENVLRQPQFQKKFEEHKKELYEFAHIVYYTHQETLNL